MGKNNVVKSENNSMLKKVGIFIKDHIFTTICLAVIVALSLFVYTTNVSNEKMLKDAKEAAYNEGYSQGEEDGINWEKENAMVATKLDFENLGILVTQESNMTIVNNYKADKKQKLFSLEFSVPFSTVQQIYSYDVQICAGIDFTKVSYVIDDDKKIITVTLPEVQTISKALDNDSFQLYYEKESAFKKVTITEINDEQGHLVDQAEETAIAKGLYDNALDNAKLIVKNLIYQFSAYSDYSVKFK